MVAGSSSTVFINEFHYDNASIDSGEFIEIANTSGTDLSGWTLVLYNGANGLVYNSISLSGSAAISTLTFPTNGIQNGAADGFALVNANGSVVQFLSYEGNLTAIEGPASGLSSTDIGVRETATTPLGASLQLTGSGTTAGDFTWSDPASANQGAANNGQTLTPLQTLKTKGTRGDETITGNALAKNIIAGRHGEDTITGAQFDDILLGNRHDDILLGQAGDDKLFGGRDDDELHGGDGDDRLSGDRGNDTLFGDAGADSFVFKKSKFGDDTIGDFDVLEDQIHFIKNDLDSFAAVQAAWSQIGNDVVIEDGSGNSVTIQNVLLAELDASHFVFA